MKKTVALIIAAGMAFSSLTALADDEIKVYVDGEQLTFDVNPIIDNERTLVPMRAIFEALGAEVTWNQDTKTASASKGNDTVNITIDSNTLYKNNEAVELDVPAKIIDDRTLVPVRAISESFDAEVLWDGEARSVIITTDKAEATAKPSENTKSSGLTDRDLEELKSKSELIRYEYEQYALPQYVFENSDTIYEGMDDYDNMTDAVTGLWDGIAIRYAIQVQANSETEYKLDYETGFELLDDAVFDYYTNIIREAGVDSASFIEGIAYAGDKYDDRIYVVVFHSADKLVQCKYLGIIASEKGAPRYFTAENDVMDAENWYFCEVTEDGRGTLTVFEKNNDETDLNAFIAIASNYYNSETKI